MYYSVFISLCCRLYFCVFFIKQTTAYYMRISDWSSELCSSELGRLVLRAASAAGGGAGDSAGAGEDADTGQGCVRHLLRSGGHEEVPFVSSGSVRSEERRVGKEGVSTCASRLSTYP